jgi:hypothetical protein
MKRRHLVLIGIGCATILTLLLIGRRVADREADRPHASSGDHVGVTLPGTGSSRHEIAGAGTAATDLNGTTPTVAAATGRQDTAPTVISGLTREPPSVTAETKPQYRLQQNAELATVNSVPIRAEDLMPDDRLSQGEAVNLSADEFKVLLARAIERELVFQQAQAQEVKLTDQQMAMLHKLEARLQGDLYQPPVTSLGGQPITNAALMVGGPGYVRFAVRDRRALELEKTLVLASGQSRSDYMSGLQSNADIQYIVPAP